MEWDERIPKSAGTWRHWAQYRVTEALGAVEDGTGRHWDQYNPVLPETETRISWYYNQYRVTRGLGGAGTSISQYCKRCRMVLGS